MAETKKEGERHYEQRFVNKKDMLGQTMLLTGTRKTQSKINPLADATLIFAERGKEKEKVVFYGASVLEKQIVELNLIGKEVKLEVAHGKRATYYVFRVM